MNQVLIQALIVDLTVVPAILIKINQNLKKKKQKSLHHQLVLESVEYLVLHRAKHTKTRMFGEGKALALVLIAPDLYLGHSLKLDIPFRLTQVH